MEEEEYRVVFWSPPTIDEVTGAVTSIQERDIILLGLFVMTFYIGDSTTPSEAQVWPEAASPLVQIRAVRWHGAWELLPLTRRPEAA
jgi:hypothetical protein